MFHSVFVLSCLFTLRLVVFCFVELVSASQLQFEIPVLVKLDFVLILSFMCVLFCLLFSQLKTWDFVELSQQESYGDIKVTPGVSTVPTHN